MGLTNRVRQGNLLINRVRRHANFSVLFRAPQIVGPVGEVRPYSPVPPDPFVPLPNAFVPDEATPGWTPVPAQALSSSAPAQPQTPARAPKEIPFAGIPVATALEREQEAVLPPAAAPLPAPAVAAPAITEATSPTAPPALAPSVPPVMRAPEAAPAAASTAPVMRAPEAAPAAASTAPVMRAPEAAPAAAPPAPVMRAPEAAPAAAPPAPVAKTSEAAPAAAPPAPVARLAVAAPAASTGVAQGISTAAPMPAAVSRATRESPALAAAPAAYQAAQSVIAPPPTETAVAATPAASANPTPAITQTSDAEWERLKRILRAHERKQTLEKQAQSGPPPGEPSTDDAPPATSRVPRTPAEPEGTSPDVQTPRKPPLEQAWPVQTTVPAGQPVLPPFAPQKTAVPPIATTDPEQERLLRTRLEQVSAGKPTDSSIEVVLPRRPRPVVPPKEEPQKKLLPFLQRKVDAEAAARQKAEQAMVQTEIGPLPADMWELLGETPPAEEGELPIGNSQLSTVHSQSPLSTHQPPASAGEPPISNPPSLVSEPQSAIANRQSEIPTPQSASREPQSAIVPEVSGPETAVWRTPAGREPEELSITNLQSPIANPQSSIVHRQSSIANPPSPTAAPPIAMPPESAVAAAVDLDALTRQVYDALRHRLMADRERGRGRWH